MKKVISVLLASIFCIVILVGLCVCGFFLLYTPSLTADFSELTGEVTSGASGYLYGIAEKGVPSENMTESIDISTVSQKVPNGLQHPIGDISHVYNQLENTDYDVVYLQDAYSTWYYEQENIERKRADGSYDWKEFVEKDYLPRVKKTVEELSKAPYSDKVVYCLYNECDNGVWFGETKQNDSEIGVYGEYNEIGANNFFEAWKLTYDYVKSLNGDALIGGPGFCDYDSNEIRAFMEYCVNNSCVPDIMIYHELNDYSIFFWQQHVRDYRAIEEELGIAELPIIVTEYGRMQDNGLPGKMLQYITQIELTKVYGDNAYWRLANNLCDVAADSNSPNSNWWLYRWYADMEGKTPLIKYQDLFRSNFENAFIKRKAEYTSQGFMGVVSINENANQIDVICGGRKGSAAVKLKNLNETSLKGKKVHIQIEEVVYKGISGIVNAPIILSEQITTINSNSLNIDLNKMDEANAYHIVIREAASFDDMDYDTTQRAARFEFESGDLLGNAYTYDSAYATTGELEGMVGGMENEGDGISLSFDAPRDAVYNLDIIYGNANDGAWDENGRQNPDDRIDASTIVAIDGEELEAPLSLPNTIKSEYTSCITLKAELTKGKHTISFKHNEGTYVLDSLVVTPTNDNSTIAVLNDSDRTTDNNKSFLAVANADGYYRLDVANADGEKITGTAYVNSVKIDNTEVNLVYLMKGLNYIDIETAENASVQISTTEDLGSFIPASSFKLSNDAKLNDNGDAVGISSEGGKASVKVKADKAGTYALTIKYSNNEENGKHAYNVDLVEEYVTISSNGKSQDVFCRNTYSWNTYNTVTAYVELKKGDNTITFTNSGKTSFDGNATNAPHINSISVNEITM